MADSLSNAAPVGAVGGFPGRNRHDVPKRQDKGAGGGGAPKGPADAVRVHHPSEVARRLLRERVLARTRQHLELEVAEFVPSFSEAVEREPVGTFLGRLIGAQNQLAALRSQSWSGDEIRHALDVALREGVAEALELLADDEADHDGSGSTFVTDVLAEYAARLERLANDELP